MRWGIERKVAEAFESGWIALDFCKKIKKFSVDFTQFHHRPVILL